MGNKELEKLLEKKKNELDALEQELMKSRYSKHVAALIAPINNSSKVIAVIHENELNGDDCRYIGEQIAKKFEALYQNFALEISARQERRKHKSDARRQRRDASNGTRVHKVPSTSDAGHIQPEDRIY